MMLRKMFVVAALLVALPSGYLLAQSDIEFPEASASIAIDEVVSGTITPDMPVVAYSLDLAAGDAISVNAEFDLDGYLLIADSAGNVLTFNDDGRDINNSNIPVFVAPDDDTYLIGVSTYSYVSFGDADMEGTFELTVTGSNALPITVGETVSGELTGDAAPAVYTLDVEQGAVLVINAASADFDITLNVVGIEQQTLALDNDDFGDSTDSQIGPFVFFEGGVYAITVGSFVGGETGAFELSVQESEPIALELGVTTESEISFDNAGTVFAFSASAGDVIDIVVTSENEALDLQAVLFAPDGSLLDFSDDEVGLQPGFVGYELPEDGTYLLLVGALTSFVMEEDFGSYTVTISAG